MNFWQSTFTVIGVVGGTGLAIWLGLHFGYKWIDRMLTGTPMLWCCHVRASDDVHPAPDYETALKWADFITDRFDRRPLKDDNDFYLKAVPAVWPWSAASHAENLPQAIAEFAPRGAHAASTPQEKGQ